MFNLFKKASQLCKYLLVLFLAAITMTPGLVSASEQVEAEFEGDLAQQIQDFSQKLRPVVSEEVEENALYSPLSYYLALLTLEPGLTGSEKEQLSEVLIPEGMDRDAYVASMASFIKEATEGDEPIFNTKTYLLGREDLEWNSTYLEDTKDLATEASSVDFKDASTYESLNEDIAELTEGLIDPYYSEERIAEMTSNDYLQLVMMNLLYFKSNWINEFNEELNTDETYYGRDDETVVSMMHQEERIPYLEGDGFQAILLPYRNQADLLIVIPDEATDDESMWEAYQSVLEQEEEINNKTIALTLPKFESSGSFDLTNSLDAFDLSNFKGDLGETDFFTTQEETALSQILQRVELVLDEEGTSAAAVTEINIETTMAPIEEEPIELKVDRPFAYGIIYKDIPLFEGLIHNISE